MLRIFAMLYQKLLKSVSVSRSYSKNNTGTVFLRHGVGPSFCLFISTVYLVLFTPYIIIISFTNCYIHIFSSSAASVFNKLSSVQGHPRSIILVPIESVYATSY